MRILYVIHSFDLHAMRGAEIVAYQEMLISQDNGHEVHVFFRKHDPLKEEYSLDEYETEGIKMHAISWCYPHLGFEKRYINETIEQIYEDLISHITPQKIVFHHLLGLSMNLPKITHKMGIASTMMIHDFWGLCDQIQMLNRDLTICKKLDWRKCVLCRAPQLELKNHPVVLAWVDRLQYWCYRPYLRLLYQFLYRTYSFYYALINPQFKQEILNRLDTYKAAINYVDQCYVPSKTYIEALILHGTPKGKLTYRPHTQKDSCSLTFNPDRSNNLYRFGFVGTIIPAKGLHVLLQALQGIKGVPLKLSIYGSFHDIPEFPNYTQYIKSFSKDKRIHFCGEFEMKDRDRVYQDIDCLVVPSVWMESGPLVIKEALNHHCFVVASDQGGMREALLNETNALLFKASSPRSLADALKKVLRKQRRAFNIT